VRLLEALEKAWGKTDEREREREREGERKYTKTKINPTELNQ
jgi:hypothetical protein